MASSAVDKSSRRVRAMFAEIASSYDRMNHLLSLQTDRYWRWRTVRLVAPRGTDPILDLCTGTGDLALAYWRFSEGQVPIVAADFCPEMLAVGEAKKQRLGIGEQLQFVEADAEQLPFPDGSFQIVSVAFGLRNVSNPDLGLQEMTRVCQSGGRVAVLEFSQPQIEPLRSLYAWYFRHVLPRIGQLCTRNASQAYHYLPTSVDQFPHGDHLAARMRDAGLSRVGFRPLTWGVATLYVGTK